MGNLILHYLRRKRIWRICEVKRRRRWIENQSVGIQKITKNISRNRVKIDKESERVI